MIIINDNFEGITNQVSHHLFNARITLPCAEVNVVKPLSVISSSSSSGNVSISVSVDVCTQVDDDDEATYDEYTIAMSFHLSSSYEGYVAFYAF